MRPSAPHNAPLRPLLAPCALCLPLLGCAEPTITAPDAAMRDLRQETDGGVAAQAINEAPVLLSEVKLGAERWREWKRDPAYLVVGMEQQLYFAGSPSPTSGPERWTIGRAMAPLGQPLQAAPRYRQLLEGRPGFWDGGDLLSPTAASGPPAAAGGTAIWYAASGDPLKPDYVFQIGLATSADEKTWDRRPVLRAPAFSSPGAEGQPLEMGPTSHGLLDPAILPQGGSTVWLYFAGMSCDPGCRFQILRAVSPDGVNFGAPQVVLSGRPTVPEEAGGVAGPSVLALGGRYYLAYTQVRTPPDRSRLGVRRALLTGSLGLAVSSDGVTFENRTGPRPLLPRNRDFFSAGSSSPALLLEGGATHLFFSAFSDSGSDQGFIIGRAQLLP